MEEVSLPALVCYVDDEGPKCLSGERLEKLYGRVASDLELLGFARRAPGGLVVDVDALRRELLPCFQQMRLAAELTGTLGKVREIARRNPWLTACRALSYCLVAKLPVKAEGWGEAGAAMISPAPFEYVLAVLAIVVFALEQSSAKEEAVRLFTDVLGLEPAGAT